MGKRVVPSNVQARKAMTEALIRLSREKPFSSITVTDLCKLAGVSRMAFYRNYDSKEEVFSTRLTELVEEYRNSTSPLLARGELWYGIGHLTKFFETMQNNAELIDSLFKCGFVWLLIEAISGYLTDVWGNGSKESEYVLIGFSGFLCSCYAPWAQDGFKETPLQMAELLNRFYLVPGMSIK